MRAIEKLPELLDKIIQETERLAETAGETASKIGAMIGDTKGPSAPLRRKSHLRSSIARDAAKKADGSTSARITGASARIVSSNGPSALTWCRRGKTKARRSGSATPSFSLAIRRPSKTDQPVESLRRSGQPRPALTPLTLRTFMATYQFPDGFVWGVATAAAQIEGAATLDGKGESIWDRFATLPGKIKNGDTPEVACDHYHRYEADFDLLVQLGIAHYRLSIAWPRVFPAGDGPINSRGLDFYSRLIDALLARGITPWVTLFHWDLPQALEEQGGWLARRTVDAFGRYADAVVQAPRRSRHALVHRQRNPLFHRQWIWQRLFRAGPASRAHAI